MPGELILTVDDEARIGELVGMYLAKDGFLHRSVTSGHQAIQVLEREQPSLIVLDVFLPDIDGYELCAALRQRTDVPIVFLTCRDSEIDKVVGLSVGADDYMSKPFSPIELVARIKAHLRRNRIVTSKVSQASAAVPPLPDPAVIATEHIRLYTDAHELYIDGKKVDLSAKEFQLLTYLMRNSKQVLTTERLLTHVWGYESSVDTKTLKVHIGHLRKKIEREAANPTRIVTIRGIGYKFNEPISHV
ncbi:two-component system response regulator VicR [Paenibacillus phyllosphaerae]|uniref:Two-component system response regulator VicR n=1 Tax=Paenibacillus phyllosphaerae TaxID=274593 RepID=A0A7W5B545_9BACL|nr:response regulator transcription factor [Paenibacillus phyllosphaerae]MBB3114354.1 two-component system response regulator VicR [Paenibacillus phyllosphaerae]